MPEVDKKNVSSLLFFGLSSKKTIKVLNLTNCQSCNRCSREAISLCVIGYLLFVVELLGHQFLLIWF